MELHGDGVAKAGEGTSTDGLPLLLSGEPMLEYQPVVDLASARLLGFEALVRWQHPTQGLILPGLLIPWAEANGDIVALGEWILHQGCRQAVAWPPSVQLAINLSIVQLRRGVASHAVAAALEESGLSPDRLTVEVTEHVMSDEYASRDLRTIAATGVQLAVDDVGTSWNSFDLLRRMEVNTIKIDASFVNGLEAHEGINRMVVETVVHLAHSSGMSTVAEGVETALHARLVREFDSDAAQGYYFAPPLSVAHAAALASDEGYRFPLDEGERDDRPLDFLDAEKTPADAAHTRDQVGRSDHERAASSEPAPSDDGSSSEPVPSDDGSSSEPARKRQPAHARSRSRKTRSSGQES